MSAEVHGKVSADRAQLASAGGLPWRAIPLRHSLERFHAELRVREIAQVLDTNRDVADRIIALRPGILLVRTWKNEC